MKRQMKMTTAKKPQKKFTGGIMRKLAGSIKDFKNLSGDTSEKIKADKAAMASADGAAAPAAAEAAGKPKSGLKNLVRSLAPAARGLRGIGRAIRGRGRAIAEAGKVPGMKKGGSVMADKMGRAMKKKTADARGRAMKGK